MCGDEVQFAKLTSCGNSCLIVACSDIASFESEELARRILDVNFGVGADNLLAYERLSNGELELTGFNPDGSPVGMCGNGVRCCAFFAKKCGLVSNKDKVVFNLQGRRVAATFNQDNSHNVEVDMGEPLFSATDIPTYLKLEKNNRALIDVDGRELEVVAVGMGNPHVVTFVNDLENYPVKETGAKLEQHKMFPEKTNVEFVQVISGELLQIRFWERSVGETLSSGSGFSAVVVASRLLGLSSEVVQLRASGGVLEGRWQGSGSSVCISAAVQEICSGVWRSSL